VVVKRVDGVQDARFSYQRGEGFVTFDTTRTSPAEFIAALERMTDYRAKLRPEPPAPRAPGAAASGRDSTAGGPDSASGGSDAAASATQHEGAGYAPNGEHS